MPAKFNVLNRRLLALTARCALIAVACISRVAIGQDNSAATAASGEPIRFLNSQECALCHASSMGAQAMRDAQNQTVAFYDLWQGSMMANSGRDPYWKAAVSAEVAALPSQKAHIEEVCTRCHTPMASPVPASPGGQVLAFLKGGSQHALGADGVSCAVCHQISETNLGTDASFTGGFVYNPHGAIYGPHANPFTMPMQHHVGYTPTEGKHILSSAMCATCHTVITESFDAAGVATSEHFHEQAPYLEWRNSIYNDEDGQHADTGRSCQSCHMPTVDATGNAVRTRLAHNPGGRDFPFLNARDPIGRHTFAGGNVFMTRLLKENAKQLDIQTPQSAFDRVIADAQKMLRNQTAKVRLETSTSTASTPAKLLVSIENLSGHKLPTAYPSRRAWIKLEVKNSQGQVVFSSGAFNAQGQLIDSRGSILPSEIPGGAILPHFASINSDTQAQVYETVMQDSDGQPTFTLLRGSRFAKDNRLLPKGWSAEHKHSLATAPMGTNFDADFTAGADQIRYELPLPAGTYKVEATMLFQTISARHVAELFQHNTPEVEQFRQMYSATDKTPEIVDQATTTIIVQPE